MEETPPARSTYYQAFTRDRHKCVYCSKDILESFDNFASSQLDHLKPRAAGGPDDEPLNRVTSCYVCNSLKGAFDPSPDGLVTASNFNETLARGREYVQKKRNGEEPNSYFRDYHYWLEEADRDG